MTLPVSLTRKYQLLLLASEATHSSAATLLDFAKPWLPRADSDLNPSTLDSMRHVMQLVYYDTSWLNDGYTVHAILSNPRLDSERIDSRLRNIKTPTLVVWGKQDQLITVEGAERYASGIAGAKLVTYDKCGHVPPQEHTGEFVKAVSEFLQ